MKQGPPGPSKPNDKQDRRARLSYAIFRWESAAILALTIILVVLVPDPFGGLLSAWRWWFWLILGFLAESGIVLTTLQDPDVRAQVANERVRARLAPTMIANVDYRQIAERALQNRAEIESMVQHTRRKTERETLRAVLDDATHWTSRIVRLAQCLDDYPDPNQIPAQAEALLQESLREQATIDARLQLIAAQGLNARRLEQLCGEIRDRARVLQETMENLQ